MLLTKRQEAELVTALQGRGEIPLKFEYLGEGAKNWDEIVKERLKGEGINSVEGKLLTKRVDDFLGTLKIEKGINIIDLGCGNASPVFPVLDKLTKSKIPFTYTPLDISRELLDLAASAVSKKYPGTKCDTVLIDFELGQFSDIMYDLRQNGFNNLMFHLGTTLGNHSDLNRVLTNFRDSMTSREYLIVGVELTNLAKISNIIPHYRTKATEDFFTFILNKHMSVSKKDYAYAAAWNSKYSQIEMSAVLNKDILVKVAGEKFTLFKNESIFLGKSIKFTEYSVTKLLSDVGFRTELLTTSEDRGYLLSMIQPTRYSV